MQAQYPYGLLGSGAWGGCVVGEVDGGDEVSCSLGMEYILHGKTVGPQMKTRG